MDATETVKPNNWAVIYTPSGRFIAGSNTHDNWTFQRDVLDAIKTGEPYEWMLAFEFPLPTDFQNGMARKIPYASSIDVTTAPVSFYTKITAVYFFADLSEGDRKILENLIETAIRSRERTLQLRAEQSSGIVRGV